MHSRLWLPATLVVLAGIAPAALSQSTKDSYGLQVGSFPSVPEASRYASKLTSLGERPNLVTVKLAARGLWTRVIIGGFRSMRAAKEQGLRLVARRAIDNFLVIPENGEIAGTRRSEPDFVSPSRPSPPNRAVTPALLDGASLMSSFPADAIPIQLPSLKVRPLMLSPQVPDCASAPRSHPVPAAIRFILGTAATSRQIAGLWVSGDVSDALARLRWIVGIRGENLLRVAYDGRVELDWEKLLQSAGVSDISRPDAAMALVEYVTSNEGLLLLVQLTEAEHRYCLHIGPSAPTRAGLIPINGGINLDRNFDSRINPHRRNRQKLENELPPAEFDALVALNPDARWLNLRTKAVVPTGHITFHELAEAYAKVDLGLDYLAVGSNPGAHDLALERERRLKSERPSSSVVLTTGSNLVFNVADQERLADDSAVAGSKRR